MKARAWALSGTVAVLAMLAVLIAAHGPANAVEPAVRWTARSSLVFFCLAFATGSRWGTPTPVSRGALLALAFSHLCHALAIVALAVQTQGANLVARGPAVVAGGFVSYVVIALAALRPRSLWAGDALWVVAFTFFFAYLPRALRAPFPFGLALLLLAAALAIRIGGPGRRAAPA